MQDIELAKEWACTEKENGFSNKYELNTTDLSILNLNNGEYHILNWLAVLLENRTFRIREDVTIRAREYILENFCVDYKCYDIVCGYRADDSYFSYANAFLNMSGVELAQTVLRYTNGISDFPEPNFSDEYGREYWAGWIRAYYRLICWSKWYTECHYLRLLEEQ